MWGQKSEFVGNSALNLRISLLSGIIFSRISSFPWTRRAAARAGRLRGGVTQRGVLRGPGMVERVLVVVRRDDEPADGIGIAGVGKMPRVVRLGLSVWHRKSSSGVSGGRRRGD